jgi:hypothetical protein
MDPDQTLKNILRLVEEITSVQGREDGYELTDIDDAVTSLCFQIDALDQWLHRGGFHPSRWR